MITGIDALRFAAGRKAQGANANIVSLPAPIGGWNARDSIAAMQPEDAVTLQNWFPSTSDVMVRKGYSNFATGLGGQVNAVMGYNPNTGSRKLFAASGSAIYDITNGGTASSMVTGLTSDKWIHTNFATSAGPFLCAVNGVDGYYVYNGTAWQSVTSSSSPIFISGVDPTLLNHINVFASRVWFIEKGSMHAWYLPVGSMGGTATKFDFSPLFRMGGYLVAMGTWTVDGGYGMQDYACWVTSEGEIAVYGGTDPSQASTWSLVGVYRLGSPMGNKCFQKYGSDLLYISKDGLAPMSKALSSTRVDTQLNLTGKIQGAISTATATYASNFGWCIQQYPIGNLLILNIPAGAGQQQQYVMNTITGAWCNFTGWNANCWELWSDNIYFGGNGVVCQAWNTFSDNSTNIQAVAQQAFQSFGTSKLKRFTMIRPILSTNGNPTTVAGVNVDYNQDIPQTTLSFIGSLPGQWDSALWDGGNWSGNLAIAKAWQGANGVGYTGSPVLKVASSGIETHWLSTDVVAEAGQVL